MHHFDTILRHFLYYNEYQSNYTLWKCSQSLAFQKWIQTMKQMNTSYTQIQDCFKRLLYSQRRQMGMLNFRISQLTYNKFMQVKMLKFGKSKDSAGTLFLLQNFLREDPFLCIGATSQTILMQLDRKPLDQKEYLKWLNFKYEARMMPK